MNPEKSYLKPSILKQVIAVAMASDAPKKMGAILLDRRNKLISTGVNSYEMTHTQQFFAAINAAKKYSQPSLAKKIWMHCELNCLLKARSEGSKLVICRVGGHGKTELRNSFCCPICYLYITKNHPSVKEIHWSTNDQHFLYIKL